MSCQNDLFVNINIFKTISDDCDVFDVTVKIITHGLPVDNRQQHKKKTKQSRASSGEELRIFSFFFLRPIMIYIILDKRHCWCVGFKRDGKVLNVFTLKLFFRCITDLILETPDRRRAFYIIANNH